MKDMRILVTGASGFLGKKVTKMLKEAGYEVIGAYLSKSDIHAYVHQVKKLDLRQTQSIFKSLSEVKPDVVVNTAAMTDVGLCEKMRDEALLINTTSVTHLANWCHGNKSKLIHISTDYVFNGLDGPYIEDSEPSPINFYGLTKYLAELLIKNLLENYVIVRPTILYGYNDKNDKQTFPIKVMKELGEKKQITVDNLRIKYPTLIDDVANGIVKLIDADMNGIVHFSNREPVTRYKWTLMIADIFDLPKEAIIGKPIEEKLSPPKPANVELINSRNLRVNFRSIREGLHIMRQQMEESNREDNSGF